MNVIDLFGKPAVTVKAPTNDWRKEWVGMPEYKNVEGVPPEVTATFKFKSDEDFQLFNTLIKKHLYKGQKVFDGAQREKVKSAWFPLKPKASKYRYR